MKRACVLFFLVFLAFLVLVNCGKEERSNPLDPNGVSYQSPQATIDFPQGGHVSRSDLLTIRWHGSDPTCEFSYKLAHASDYSNSPRSGWSNWTSEQEATIEKLDEEAYTFGVRARYPQGEKQESPDTVSFYVNALPDSGSLFISPRFTEVSSGETLTVEVTIETSDTLIAANIFLSFTPSALELQSFEWPAEVPVHIDSINNPQGQTKVYLGLSPPGATGRIVLVLVKFEAKSRGQGNIDFGSYDLRNAHNDTIRIREQRGAEVHIIE